MIMPIALAKEGFINRNESAKFANTDSFFDCLKKIFNFIDMDLQGFDGNNCTLINSFNPTNSLFIYTNDTGTFLYKITNATPVLHLNNLLWLCDTYMLDTQENLNKACEPNCVVKMYKNIMPQSTSGASQNVPILKENFRPVSRFYENLGRTAQDGFVYLKIKCYTNPTTLDLTTSSPDGSYNFYFPVALYYYTTSGYVNKCLQKCYNVENPEDVISLAEVISTYSVAIQSIEALPAWSKLYEEDYFGGGIFDAELIQTTDAENGAIPVTLRGNAVWTPLGVLLQSPINSTPFGISLPSLTAVDMPMQVIKGGGVRGFVRTPVGNVEIDTLYNKENLTATTQGYIYLYYREQGFTIDGAFRADILPTYLDFYTDNAGQTYLANLTSNALELRNINRETQAKYEDLSASYELKQITTAIQGASNIANAAATGTGLNRLTGAASATLQLATDVGVNALQNSYAKSQISIDYSRALGQYEDNIQTETLLNQLTGKQIGGNVSLSELNILLNGNYWTFFIEFNYLPIKIGQTRTLYKQINYDYGCQTPYFASNPNNTNLVSYKTNFNRTQATLAQMICQIFGYDVDDSASNYINFIDRVGLNYSIVFEIVNMTSGTASRILEFNIRNKEIVQKT